jgi:hypothetical protein
VTQPDDAFIIALHRAATVVCPPAVCERIAQQALADLAEERHAASGPLLRCWVTLRGVALLGVAVVWSVWALRGQWDIQVGIARQVGGWFVLMTLLVTLWIGRGSFDALHLLNPLFVLQYFAPVAVPLAALGFALTFNAARLRSILILASTATAVSMALTMGPRALDAITDARVASRSTGATVVLAGHSVPIPTQQLISERLREQVQEFVGWPLQLALLSLLLPILGWLLVRMRRVPATQATAFLVSIAALEPLRLWIRFRALDPGAAWNLHLVLLAGISVTAVTLWLRQDRTAE